MNRVVTKDGGAEAPRRRARVSRSNGAGPKGPSPAAERRVGKGGRRLAEAFEYVRGLHARQVRKGTTIPYRAHLLAVASLVIESGGNEDEADQPAHRESAQNPAGFAQRTKFLHRICREESNLRRAKLAGWLLRVAKLLRNHLRR